MMKKIFIIICLQAILLVSCKDGFRELSKNPNSSEFALPQAFLAPALVDVVNANMSRNRRINNELMQVHVNVGNADGNGKIFRFDIRPTEADYMWNNWYVSITNFQSMYASAAELFKVNANNANKTYMAIALINEAWVYSLITDTYGDVPYFDANKGKQGILTPKFDKQQDIYADIFKNLEQANVLLTTNANLPADQVGSDPIYAGVAAKWRKFGNSLYLRLLLRVSAKLDVAAKIKEIVDTKASTYPIISSNAESAILRWTGVLPYQSPFQNMRDADWNDNKSAEFFVNNLKNWSDPRLAKWVTLKDGQYAGMPSGYLVGTNPAAKSLLPTALKTEPLLGNIMNYAEVQFILAEAALRGWISTPAKTYYEQGVTNGITLWGYTLPANYLTSVNVKWEESDSFDGKLESIHLQKYYALFYTDFQQWFEYRRTGHPILVLGPGVQNNGKMPARMNYPAYLQSTNHDNYNAAVALQGEDGIATQVWWQKP